jgi:hypothetical protein
MIRPKAKRFIEQLHGSPEMSGLSGGQCRSEQRFEMTGLCLEPARRMSRSRLRCAVAAAAHFCEIE